MGSSSSSSRKSNDTVIINRPKKKGVGEGTGGGQSGQSPNGDMNVVCPVTFRVSLHSKKPLPDKAKLHLKDTDVLLAGEKVGTLSKSRVSTIARCLGEGFRYEGEVVTKGTNQHGLFTRV